MKRLLLGLCLALTLYVTLRALVTVTDLFDDTPGVLLESHASPMNWALTAFYDTSLEITDSNRVAQKAASGWTNYYSNWPTTTNQYVVGCSFHVFTTDVLGHYYWIAARSDPATQTYYRVGYETYTNSWFISLEIGFANQFFTSGSAYPLADGSIHNVTFEVLDASKTLYVDYVSELTTADDTLTDVGYAGIGTYTDPAEALATDTAGIHFDDCIIQDYEASGATGRSTRMLLGVGR